MMKQTRKGDTTKNASDGENLATQGDANDPSGNLGLGNYKHIKQNTEMQGWGVALARRGELLRVEVPPQKNLATRSRQSLAPGASVGGAVPRRYFGAIASERIHRPRSRPERPARRAPRRLR